MDTPMGQTQSKTRAAHQKTLRGKEGFEMKTAMVMGKAKVWISETVGTKIATRLFRGLALGVLVVAATGIYFSINQGEAGSPLISEQAEVYPEFNMVGRYGPLSFEIPEDPAPISGSRLSFEKLEFAQELELMGMPWRVDDEGKVVVVEAARQEKTEAYPDWAMFDAAPVPALATGAASSSVPFEYWSEIDLDSNTYHQFMLDQGKAGRRLSSEQIEFIQDLDTLGYPWRIDDQGRVVVGEAARKSVMGSPLVSKQTDCYPELDIC